MLITTQTRAPNFNQKFREVSCPGDTSDFNLAHEPLHLHVAPSTATAFIVVRPDACWTCATCYCANVRAACADCRKQRPSTSRQTDALIDAAVPLDAQRQHFNGNTALINASGKGHLDLVQALLAAGADTAAQNQHGCTALILASLYGHLEVVQVLAAGRGRGHRRPEPARRHCAHRREWRGPPGGGAGGAGRGRGYRRPEPQQGNTALIYASVDGHLEVVQALLAAGADTAAQNKDSVTALIHASANGHLGVARCWLAVRALPPSTSTVALASALPHTRAFVL